MAVEIEGNWKNFVFQIGTEADASEASQHVRNFFLRDEPMNKYLGWSDDNGRDHDKLVKLILSHGLSLIIREKETGEVIGLNLVLDSRLSALRTIFSPESPPCTNMTNIITLYTFLDESVKEIFQKLFPFDFFAQILISSVSRIHRDHGIITEAYKRMILLLKSKGFHVVESEFTNPFTRAAGKKLGFIELDKFFFKDIPNGKGQRLFPTAGDGEEEYVSKVAFLLG